MGEIGLLLAGWDRRTGRNGWDGGSMEGPSVAGAGLGVLPLALDVRLAAGRGSCHHFHWCCRGHGLFVSVQKKIHNTLHTNPNHNIVQDSTKSTYNIIVL